MLPNWKLSSDDLQFDAGLCTGANTICSACPIDSGNIPTKISLLKSFVCWALRVACDTERNILSRYLFS
jgi:hypothetical protein